MNQNRIRHFPPTRCLLTAWIAIFCSFLPGTTVGWQVLTPPVAKPNPTNADPIKQLLTTEWERNRANEKAAQTTFEQATSVDETLMLAYVLNRLQQNRTDEALTVVDEMTTQFPQNLDGWLIKSWQNTLTNKFDLALINMRSLKKQIDQQKNLPDATLETIYRRLGRLIGYLQGPVVDRVNKDILGDTVKLVVADVSPKILAVFNENREQVLKAHDELLKVQGEETQVQLAKVQIANENEAQNLERENQILAETENRLIPEKEKLRNEAAQQTYTLERQLSTLQQQLSNVSADIQSTQYNLQLLYSDLYYAQNQPPGYYPSYRFLQDQIRNAEYSLSGLRNSGNSISNQIGGLRNQIVFTQRTFNGQIANLEKEIKKVRNAQRRNLAKLTRIAQGPEIASGKRDSMRNKATALTTYDEFPVALYRAELVDWVNQ